MSDRQARTYLAELESVEFIRRDGTPGKSNRFVFLWHQIFDEPRKDTSALPRKDTSAKESHHQRESIEESHCATALARRCPDLEDDDQARKHFRECLRLWHADTINVDNTVRQVSKQLAKLEPEPWRLFVRRIYDVTVPERVNGGGYYVSIAKTLVVERVCATQTLSLDIREIMLQSAQSDTWTRRSCDRGCDMNGMLPDGSYCSCEIGQMAEQIFERARSTTDTDRKVYP